MRFLRRCKLVLTRIIWLDVSHEVPLGSVGGGQRGQAQQVPYPLVLYEGVEADVELYNRGPCLRFIMPDRFEFLHGADPGPGGCRRRCRYTMASCSVGGGTPAAGNVNPKYPNSKILGM